VTNQKAIRDDVFPASLSSGANIPFNAEDAASRGLSRLMVYFQSRFPHLDHALIFDAVVDEIMSILSSNSDALIAGAFGNQRELSNRVWRRLCHCVRSESRRKIRECSWAEFQTQVIDETSLSWGGHDEEPLCGLALSLAKTPQEITLVALWLQGEKKTAVYANALGLAGTDGSACTREVKRLKDRLKKRWLRRLKRPL
jgi:hypothetical protein